MISLAMFSGPAAASPAVEARVFDEQGRAAYAARRFHDALEAFLLSYELTGSARGLYNVALAADGADRDQAYAFYARYLQSDDRDPERRQHAERRSAILGRTRALVHVVTTPADADIVVDDAAHGVYGRSPWTLALSPGPHTIVLSRAGHEPREVNVTLFARQTTNVRETLTPLPGTLRVVAQTDATATVLDGTREVSAGAVNDPMNVPPGRYALRVSAPRREDATRYVRIEPGQSRAELVHLRPRFAQSGRLLVRATDHEGASVSVDGELRGVTPAVFDLPIGSHAIEVEDAGRVWRGEVVVRDGHSESLEVSLVEERE